MSVIHRGLDPHDTPSLTPKKGQIQPIKLLSYSWKKSSLDEPDPSHKFHSWDDAIKRAQEEAFKALQQKSMVQPWIDGPMATHCPKSSFVSKDDGSTTSEVEADTISLRNQLKIVRDVRMHPFDELPDGNGESIGAFANRHAVLRYTQKVESKRQRARELRRVKRKREMGTGKDKSVARKKVRLSKSTSNPSVH